jgi:hypothetical protein
LCLLEALTTQIKIDSEIVEAKWESISKFRNEYAISPLTKYLTDLVINSLHNPSTDTSLRTFQEKQIATLDGKSRYTLYHWR